MDERQKIAAFLQNIATKIPQLFDVISEGNASSQFVLGTRQINGKQVQLIIKAETVEQGTDEAMNAAECSKLDEPV